MMHHAQAEANRIRRTVKGKSNAKEAAEVMASVLIALETARKYLPTARIPRMTAKRAALEAYIAMMQEGRYGINRNGSTKRRGLTEAEIEATIARVQEIMQNDFAFAVKQNDLDVGDMTDEETAAKRIRENELRCRPAGV